MTRLSFLALVPLVVMLGDAFVDGQSPAPADPAQAIAAAEREFARTSVEIGQRDSFLKFFAEDGIRFLPEPVNARASLLKTPPEPTPRPRTLDWEPLFVLAARSGEMGLSTGPVEVRDNSSTPARVLARAWYFSVWKLQPDKTWRVVADLGITDPTAPPLRTKPLVVAKLLGAESPVPRGEGADALERFDRQVSAQAEKEGIATAYLPRVDAESRLLRDGHPPAVGPEAIGALLAAAPKGTDKRSTSFSAVSGAGDFGYTYGTYEHVPADSNAKAMKGSYVRVWKRKNQADWILAADIVNAR